MAEDTNGRTHEPSLRELTVEIDGLRALLLSKIESTKQILDERDKLYKERDDSRRTAVDAALSAAKEQTKASFEASEKAIVKAEEAQKSYNQSHNDLARKMDDQSKATMPRSETEARFHALEEKVNEVRNVVSAGTGVITGSRGVKEETRANVGTIGTLVGIVIAILGLFGLEIMRVAK
jgi:chromosome segregation ATPase